MFDFVVVWHVFCFGVLIFIRIFVCVRCSACLFLCKYWFHGLVLGLRLGFNLLLFFICLGSRCVLRLLLLGFQFFVVLMSWFSDVFLEFKCVVVLILLCSCCVVDVLGFLICFMFDVLVFRIVLLLCSWFSNLCLFCFVLVSWFSDSFVCSDSLVFLLFFFDLKLRRDVRTYSQCHIFKATAGALRHNVHSHFGIRLRQPQWIYFMWMNYSPMPTHR